MNPWFVKLKTRRVQGTWLLALCSFCVVWANTVTAQLPTAAEFDLRLNPAKDSVRVYIRHNSPSPFTGVVSGLVVTVRYDTLPGVAGPRLPSGSDGRTQFGSPCYSVNGNPGAPVTSGSFKYKAYTAVSLLPIIDPIDPGQNCPGGVLPGNNVWKLLFRVRVDNAASANCRTFQIAALGDPFIPFNLDPFLSLNGREIPVGVEPTPEVAGFCSAGVALQARALLEGPYAGNGLMHDDLRSLPGFPVSQPYGGAPFNHTGTETVAPAVLAISGPSAIVDWVLVELRNNANAATVVARRAGLLRADGAIVHTDGTSALQFVGTPNGNYRVAVRHRNHLGIMTASAVALSAAPVSVDLTLSGTATFGVDARKVDGSLRVMWMGNVIPDNALWYTGDDNDRDPMLQYLGGVLGATVSNVYTAQDTNMDSRVLYTGDDNDRDPLLVNVGGVLGGTRLEQLP